MGTHSQGALSARSGLPGYSIASFPKADNPTSFIAVPPVPTNPIQDILSRSKADFIWLHISEALGFSGIFTTRYNNCGSQVPCFGNSIYFSNRGHRQSGSLLF